MDDGARPASGHLMLISPERVFYAGLLGKPRQRTSGGLNIYVALHGELSVVQGSTTTRGEMVVVPPYTVHSVESDYPSTVCIVIEPETVLSPVLAALARRLTGPGGEALAARIRGAYEALRITGRRDGFTTCEFDTIFFGERLAARPLDPRICNAIARICEFSNVNVNAAECAAAVNLSQSRFLHLFKEQTGVSFRAFRAWKRARHLLHYVNENINLAHLAQDIGYPDSTHFSHSIRRFYGLKPRAIFIGSRDLAIYRSDASIGLGLRSGKS
ncbi:MAG TPA: helix-turn-helix domain-containing protein [Xanthobacteraceae bacterium]|nr:helix-turn-helix domain-containing protein [Xanthobacteraceae bacterium]